MKSGFTLIELMLALLISSLMVISLYQMLSQTRRGVARITDIMDVDVPLIALYTQLEKDVTGMFAPQKALKPFIEKEMKKKQAQTKQEAQQRQQQTPSIPATAQEKKAPEDPVLVIEQKGTDLFWSFITTGTLQTVDREGKLVPTPYVRRVAYMLEKDPNNPAALRLMYRYETDRTDLKPLRAPQFSPSYEIASGIKNFSVELTVYEAVEEKKANAEQEQKGQEKKVPPSAALKEWKESEVWDKYKSLIPAYVMIKGSRVDSAGKIEYPFEFMFKVYAYNQYRPKPPASQQMPSSGSPVQDLEKWMKERGADLLKNGQNQPPDTPSAGTAFAGTAVAGNRGQGES